MPEDRSPRGRPASAWWMDLAGVLFVVLALYLGGTILIQASPAADARAPSPAQLPTPSVITQTVFLPTILQNHSTWDARGLIAFERQLAEGGPHDIFLMRDDGSGMINVTNHPADDGAPAWSPDGSSIAFASDRVDNGNTAIFRLDLLTGEAIQLTSGEHQDRWPSWSPDGSQIAFMRRIYTNGHANREVFAMNADGSNQHNVTNYEWGDDFPAWSWDGEWIAFVSERYWGGRDLWVIRPDGSDAHIVARTDFQEELYPTWSPDGRIYYTFSPTEKAELLYRIWPDGSGMEPVFADGYKRYIASWSPDGHCFVYYSYLGGPDKEVWKWCDGFSASVNLTDNANISDEFCAWSPVP
ncbi:MAG: TolB family protein [Anaerolineae bacterium]|jgi:TolB protein